MTLHLSDASDRERSANFSWPSSFPAVPHSVHCEVRRVPKGWWLRFDFDIRDGRDVWMATGLYTDRDEAAREAADLFLVGLDLAERHARGEAIETPWQRREKAWYRSPEYLAAHKVYEDAIHERSAIDLDSSGWHALRREATERIDRAQEALSAAKGAWWAAHPWREFAEVRGVERRGQLDLFGKAAA